MFTWTPSDMPGVPWELAVHSLDVGKTAKPVKQKLHYFAKDRQEVIRIQILKLLAFRFICECKNPVWLNNPVLVLKKICQCRMCIDYTDHNMHYPKDPSPFCASTRSSTTQREASCYASSTAT
jgi:hypothetical protein